MKETPNSGKYSETVKLDRRLSRDTVFGTHREGGRP